MRDIYPRTEQLSTVINDPRVSGVIKEHGGKLYMIEKQWKKACDELFEAFKCYQEVANSNAKTILKYVILASIISESEINYAETQEAKVYQEDKEIGALCTPLASIRPPKCSKCNEVSKRRRRSKPIKVYVSLISLQMMIAVFRQWLVTYQILSNLLSNDL